MQFQLAELQSQVGLEGADVRLVVRVVECRTTECRQPGSDTGRGQVLDHPVVLVSACAFSHQW